MSTSDKRSYAKHGRVEAPRTRIDRDRARVDRLQRSYGLRRRTKGHPIDWTTTSALATAVGTLVLAAATFASVRSANKAARVAEQALLVGMRPLLIPSGPEDEAQKIRFVDGRYVKLPGGRAVAELDDEDAYLAISLRNAGTGIGVIHGWRFWPNDPAMDPPLDPDGFRSQTRDLYVSPGIVGFWQGAIRDPRDVEHDALRDAVASGALFAVDLLYGDRDAGQQTITRFVLERPGDGHDWLTSAVRHWSIDGPRIRR